MPEAQGEPFDIAFETLILYIQESRGFDFRGYKRTSLRRRIRLRMEALGLRTSLLITPSWKFIRRSSVNSSTLS